MIEDATDSATWRRAGVPVLSVSDVTVRFGGLTVLNRVAFQLRRGTFLAIVGPNGAGKTTLLNAVSGLVRVDSGSIRLQLESTESELVYTPPHARPGLGIGRTFQQSRLFEGLTVLEQLMCGAYRRDSSGLAAAVVRSPKMLRGERYLIGEAEALLAELGLEGRGGVVVGDLPGPHRRLVDLARSLMGNPRILLLDEIAAGTPEHERDRVIALLEAWRERQGLSVVLIEHDLEFVRRLADQLLVIVHGEVLAAGSPHNVLSQPDVMAAYVGDEKTA